MYARWLCWSVRFVMTGNVCFWRFLSTHRSDAVNGRLADALYMYTVCRWCIMLALTAAIIRCIYSLWLRSALKKMSLTPHPSCGKNIIYIYIYIRYGEQWEKGTWQWRRAPLQIPATREPSPTTTSARPRPSTCGERNGRLAMSRRRVLKMRCMNVYSMVSKIVRFMLYLYILYYITPKYMNDGYGRVSSRCIRSRHARKKPWRRVSSVSVRERENEREKEKSVILVTVV